MRSLNGYLPIPAFAMAKKKSKNLKAGASVEVPAFSTLDEVHLSLKDCQRCGLCEGRTQIMLGEGNPHPTFMFVGEAPGEKEDETGRPFMGRSGELLTKMIEAMGLKREEAFISSVVKCRPPENRAPRPEEVEQCLPFLEAQIEMLKPKIVIALGATAAKNLLRSERAISELRGKVHDYRGTKLVATYHPAYLLRNPSAKKDCWEDLQFAMKETGWRK